MDRKHKTGQEQHDSPKYAPSLENDELDLEASEEEVKRGEYTKTTKLFLDRLDD